VTVKKPGICLTRIKPDICVFDVMMPEMDGFTLAEKVKEVHPEVPVIFLTAKSPEGRYCKGPENRKL